MFHNNLHVDYYLCPRDDFKTRLFVACVQTLLAIVNESQGGTCKVCELASIIEF